MLFVPKIFGRKPPPLYYYDYYKYNYDYYDYYNYYYYDYDYYNYDYYDNCD